MKLLKNLLTLFPEKTPGEKKENVLKRPKDKQIKSYISNLFHLFFAITFVLTGCTVADPGNNNRNAENTAILKVGVSTNAPPLIYKKGGEIAGLEASLAKKFAVYLNRQIRFVEVPWDKQIEYLNDGKTDIIMSGMTITKARNYLVDFSTPYLRSGQILLVRLQDKRKFSGGAVSLMNTNSRIGTIQGTVGDMFVTSTINQAIRLSFKKSSDAVQALIKNEIDVLVYDAPVVCHYAAVHQADQIVPVLEMATEEYLGWAMRRNDPDLKTNADAFLNQISSNGELKKEINRWIPYLDR